MPEALKCPNCSAPLEVSEAKGQTVACEYCGHDVLLPFTREEASGWAEMPLFDGPLMGGVMRLAEVGKLARAGRRDEAVKLYSELSGCGPEEAAAAVARILQGQPVTIVQTSVRHSRGQADARLDLSALGEQIASAFEPTPAMKTIRPVAQPVVIDARPVGSLLLKIFLAVFGLALALFLAVFVFGVFVAKQAVDKATEPAAKPVESAPSAPKRR
jgi:hypothetical protein